MKRKELYENGIVEFFYEKIWKQIGAGKDRKLKESYRCFYRNTEEELEKQVAVHRKRQIFITLIFLTAFFFLAISSVFTEKTVETDIFIERNAYGEGEREEILFSEEGEEIHFLVREQTYTEEELNQAFEMGFREARELVLGENASETEIQTDLNFITELSGGITAEWITDAPELIGYDGQVFNEDMEEEDGQLVTVMLNLYCQNESRSQNLYFYIKAPSYTERERQLKEIAEAIQLKEEAARTDSSFAVPAKIGDVRLIQQKNNPVTGMMLVLAAAFIYFLFYNNNQLKEKKKERIRQLEEDYPMIINKIVLYLGAGMNLRRAFSQIAGEYKEDLEAGNVSNRYVYDEMLVMMNELQAGRGEIRAYESFGQRMGMNSYNKLISLLVQNLQKGNDDLLKALRNEEGNAFFLRLDQAKRKGEEASTKLLFPMLVMLLVVMVIVMAPALFQFAGY